MSKKQNKIYKNGLQLGWKSAWVGLKGIRPVMSTSGCITWDLLFFCMTSSPWLSLRVLSEAWIWDMVSLLVID